MKTNLDLEKILLEKEPSEMSFDELNYLGFGSLNLYGYNVLDISLSMSRRDISEFLFNLSNQIVLEAYVRDKIVPSPEENFEAYNSFKKKIESQFDIKGVCLSPFLIYDLDEHDVLNPIATGRVLISNDFRKLPFFNHCIDDEHRNDVESSVYSFFSEKKNNFFEISSIAVKEKSRNGDSFLKTILDIACFFSSIDLATSGVLCSSKRNALIYKRIANTHILNDTYRESINGGIAMDYIASVFSLESNFPDDSQDLKKGLGCYKRDKILSESLFYHFSGGFY